MEEHQVLEDHPMDHNPSEGSFVHDTGEKKDIRLRSFDAAADGNIDKVRNLLQLGADIQREYYMKKTALHLAISNGEKELVQLLLEHGAIVDAKDEKLNTPLHDAAWHGNKEAVQLLLEYGAAIDARDARLNTPLHNAADYGSKEVVQLLLKHGAAIDAKDVRLNTPLHDAARNGHKEVIQLLLEHDAAIDAENVNLNTPLHHATRNKHEEVVRLLLEHGAPVDAINVNFNTPLHYATRNKHEEVVRLLLEYGAAVNAKDVKLNTPLHDAACNGHKEVIQLLLEHGAAIDAKDVNLNTPLHHATSYKHEEVVRLLLEHNAAVNAKDDKLNTPLHKAAAAATAAAAAAMFGFKEIVQLLLKHGATVDAKDANFMTPLHISCRNRDKEVVQLLLEHGAAVNAIDAKLNTPLHNATDYGSKEVVQLLLEHGAAVNAKDAKLNTPLHNATDCGSKKVVQLLLKHGAAVNAKDVKLNTPLHKAAALEYGGQEVIQLLLDNGAVIDEKNDELRTSLYIAANNGNIGNVWKLLTSNANANERSKDGKTILAEMSGAGDLHVAPLLLKHGAEIEALDLIGQTPFIIASKASRIEMLSLLISNGANIQAADNELLTALHTSAKEGNLDVLEFLLKNGANVNSITKYGDTALHLAAKYNHSNSVTTLLENGAYIDAENKVGNTPVQVAIMKGNIEVVYQLAAAEAAIGNQEDRDLSILYLAVDAGQVELVKRALDTLGTRNESLSYLNTALYRASRYGHNEIMSHLLKFGADIEADEEDGLSALFVASRHPEAFAMLINRGAFIEATNANGPHQSVLHHIVTFCHIDALRILLTCGCNIQAVDDHDNTALHYVAINGNCEVAATLLHHGADINVVNDEGFTALHVAIHNDSYDLARLLIDTEIDIEAKDWLSQSTPLLTAVKLMKPQFISLLVERHANVNTRNIFKETALLWAIRHNLEEECALMLRHGANVNAESLYGNTPLKAAVMNYNPTLLKQVLSHRASTGSPAITSLLRNAMEDGYSRRSYKFPRKFIEVIEALIDAGADTYGIHIEERMERKFPILRDIWTKSHEKQLGKERTSLDIAPALEDGYEEKDDIFDAVLKEFIHHPSNEYRVSLYNERWLFHTKHKYGYNLPLSKNLLFVTLPITDESDSQGISAVKPPPAQSLIPFDTKPVNDRVIAIIQYLLTCFNTRMFTSDHFFMLELDGYVDKIPPEWASHFDKMKGIIREPGRLIVQIPLERIAWSRTSWRECSHPYLHFIDAIYVCRRSSTRLDEEVFSDLLGESEQKIATDLHAVLIAGLSILSIAGGDRLIEKLVKAILGEQLDPSKASSPVDLHDEWQIRNRRHCPCNAEGIHRPLSPVAAAKAVGINIWRIQQIEKVARVWDLTQDILVDDVDVSKVIFVTHKWDEPEADYQDVKGLRRWLGQKVSSLSKKLQRIKRILQPHTKYVWMDTICIDKSNLSELDRAIRSMYKWYASCAAVVLDSGTPLNVWCQRGWCLQEGAAAGVLYGISKEGTLATIQQLANEQGHELCTLDLHLCYRPGNAAEIITRMDARQTTYAEDMAYALTGIFSIHLTLAYGEGIIARERLLHELATKKGDLSFLSFQSTQTRFRNYLPAIKQANHLIAKCTEASAPIMVSHFGICFDVQLVEGSDASLVLKKLDFWKDLSFAKGRSIGVKQFIKMAESQGSESLKLAIVHYIRSIILVETYDKDFQTGGAGRQIERCHRMQCCQIEEKEFTRLFKEDGTKLERIWLRDKPDGAGANMTASGQFLSKEVDVEE